VTHPYYLTKAWKRLREERLKYDRHRCVVPGCGQPAVVVDHIQPRLAGGPDSLWNLRSLCREHDNAVKERPGGKRANEGKLVVRGYNADGSPIDPGHAWYKTGK
jgi:5-methylcytosine-specific restriction endonuclease McrA